MRTLLVLCAFAVGAALLCGCNGPSMAPVKGRVMFDGKPVKNAAVTFAPIGAEGRKETGKPATGFTDENGNFELSTFKNYDGALIGQHSVNVVLDDSNPAKCQRTKALTLEVKSSGNEFTIEMDPK
jgi:uncharacterized GH25 family protein